MEFNSTMQEASNPHPGSQTRCSPRQALFAAGKAKNQPRPPTVRKLIPHSPSVIPQNTAGVSARVSSASQRGTKEMMRPGSTRPSASKRRNVAAKASPSPERDSPGDYLLGTVSAVAASSPAFTPPPPSPVKKSAPDTQFFIVGGAVLNPLLALSPSVQQEVRGVASLTLPSDALRRGCTGPLLTCGSSAEDAATTTPLNGTSARQGRNRIDLGAVSPPSFSTMKQSDGGDASDAIICVDALRVHHARDEEVPLLQQAQASATSSLNTLRWLFGTTADDVVEPARPSTRNGLVESPRMRHYTTQELLPELANPEARINELAAARRLIDWDVSIPTANTLPPPAITFLSRNGQPCLQLTSLHFTFDTATHVLQRRYAAASGGKGTLSATSSPKKLLDGQRQQDGAAAAEDDVGTMIFHDDNSDAYRVCRLVGLRCGLAERVGLERVMEYHVTAETFDLFLSSPYIDADTGDLILDLNTSLSGMVKLILTGVDCGSVDPVMAEVQRSSNVLTCTIELHHSGHHSHSATDFATSPEASSRPNTRFGNTDGMRSGTFTSSFMSTGQQVRNVAAEVARNENPNYALNLAPFNRDLMDRSMPRDASATRNKDGTRRGMRSTSPRPLSSGEGGPALAPLKRLGAKDDASSRFMFPVSCPHQLRYHHNAESTRLRRIEQLRCRTQKMKEARSAETVATSADGRASEALWERQSETAATGSSNVSPPPQQQQNHPLADEEVGDIEVVSPASQDEGAPLTSPNVISPLVAQPFAKLPVVNDTTSKISSDISPEDQLLKQEAREIHPEALPTSWFFTGSVQSPISYFRYTVWQDRLTALLHDDDHDLLQSQQRSAFKRKARQELGDTMMAGITGAGFMWSASGSSAPANGRHGSISRHSISTGIPQNYQPSTDSTLMNPFLTTSTKAGGREAFEKTFGTLRRLILCLLLEEERGSLQLYSDIVQLNGHLCQSCLLKTTAVTRGTREGLQQAAAAKLAGSGPASPFRTAARSPSVTTSFPLADAPGDIAEKGIRPLQMLAEALELAMTGMMLIGAYGDAVEYGMQRVHTLCLLEGDTTAVVNAAQKDLTEAYLFYGDYSTAVTIAEDVVMLTRQLNHHVDCYDVVEAEGLCALACIPAGRRDLVMKYVGKMELSLLPLEAIAHVQIDSLFQAQLRLTLAFSRLWLQKTSHTADDGMGTTVPMVVELLQDAVQLLQGDGDLKEMERSYSTVRSGIGVGGTNAANQAAPNVPPGTASATSQKRLRWNLLSFAGSLLVKSGAVEDGLAAMESTVQELVLGQHRYIERRNRAAIAAILWVDLVVTRWRSTPQDNTETAALLKQMADRVTRLKGPLHPFAAMSNIIHSYATDPTHARQALSVAQRSLSALERAVQGKSYYLLAGHYITAYLYGALQRWRHAVEHINIAYIIGQTTHLAEDEMVKIEKNLLGHLLQCPNNVAVDINVASFQQRLQDRVQSIEEFHGPRSEQLISPLVNLAEWFYLLRNYELALTHLLRVMRLIDTKGTLLVSVDLLKPASPSTTPTAIQKRNHIMRTAFGSTTGVLRLAIVLFMIGSTLEVQGKVNEALEFYLRCIALYETVELGDSCLAAISVMVAISKLLYTAMEYGDALSWARRAEASMHLHLRTDWLLEKDELAKLTAVIEYALYQKEGTYVTQNANPLYTSFPELL